jgi:hypothetical protein
VNRYHEIDGALEAYCNARTQNLGVESFMAEYEAGNVNRDGTLN